MMLLVDLSASEFFGTTDQFKRDIITEISATLAFSAIQNNDKVGLLLFSDEIELFIPPKKGKSHVLRIIRELIEFQPKSKKTDIAKALRYLSQVMKKKAIVFLLSDFMDDEYDSPLKIASRRHDITGIRIYDKYEVEMPKIGIVPMEDVETGNVILVNTNNRNIRNSYKANYLEHVDYFETVFSKSGAGTISTRVDEGYVKKLLGYFKRRN